MTRKSKSRSLYTGDPEGAQEHYSMIQLFNFTSYFYRNVFTGRLIFYQVVNHIILPVRFTDGSTGGSYRLVLPVVSKQTIRFYSLYITTNALYDSLKSVVFGEWHF